MPDPSTSPYASLFSAPLGNRLSIVVQGGLNNDTIVQAANHCQHWRDLFPEAEIILALSTLDIIEGIQADGDPAHICLTTRQGSHGMASMALEVISKACDKVVQAHGALPLPPIKTDSPGFNNVNLQILAAQAGLEVVTGTHVLRTRIDLIFADDGFIGQWLDGHVLPRGSANALRQRVLISYLYTLNPYAGERMPLHYSDWFHFGLTEDVRVLWDVPVMTLADSVHYKTHAFADYSNAQERRMLTRLAVEQHLSLNAWLKYFPDLTLGFHNDLTDVRKSIDILCDNFIICDLIAARCIFEKYAQDFESRAKRLDCIPADDWRKLAMAGADEREALLRDNGRMAADHSLAPFPRHYPARSMSTGIGERTHDSIMAFSKAGLLMHGPYDTLPRGCYTARIDLQRFEGKGLIDLRVTLDSGAAVLAERYMALSGDHNEDLVIDFDIDQDIGSALEVVVHAPGIPTIVLGQLTIHQRTDGSANPFIMTLLATQLPMRSNVGANASNRLCTTGKAGYLLFGPYVALEPGRYTVVIHFHNARSPGRSRVEITGGKNFKRLASQVIGQDDLDRGQIELAFALSSRMDSVECRIKIDDRAALEIGSVDWRRW